MPPGVQDKAELRRQMRLTLLACQPSSEPACTALSHWLSQNPAVKKIAVYSPLPGEVDLSPIILARPDLTWLYPRVTGPDLTFHQGGNLTAGSFKILEPDATAPIVAISDINVFICPGLAFDPLGGRLGRGRGFYDRALAQAHPTAIKLGICFQFQKVETTFPEPHDIRMDHVL